MAIAIHTEIAHELDGAPEGECEDQMQLRVGVKVKLGQSIGRKLKSPMGTYEKS